MALREDDAVFALPLGGGTPRLPVAVVDFLLACRPEWHADALCHEYPELSWFDPEAAEAAAAVCRRCAVSGECGSWAVENGVSAGMWAGVVRDPPRRKRPAVVASDGAPPKVRAIVPEPSRAEAEWVADSNALDFATAPESRQHFDDRPPPPATCEWCPMPAKKGHELCKSCEREMVERFAV